MTIIFYYWSCNISAFGCFILWPAFELGGTTERSVFLTPVNKISVSRQTSRFVMLNNACWSLDYFLALSFSTLYPAPVIFVVKKKNNFLVYKVLRAWETGSIQIYMTNNVIMNILDGNCIALHFQGQTIQNQI